MSPKQSLLPGVTSIMTVSSPTHFCLTTYWGKKKYRFHFKQRADIWDNLICDRIITKILPCTCSPQASHVGSVLEVLHIYFRKPVRPFSLEEDDGHFFLFGWRPTPSAHLPHHVLPVSVCPSISSLGLVRQRRPWLHQSRPFFDSHPLEGGRSVSSKLSQTIHFGIDRDLINHPREEQIWRREVKEFVPAWIWAQTMKRRLWKACICNNLGMQSHTYCVTMPLPAQ